MEQIKYAEDHHFRCEKRYDKSIAYEHRSPEKAWLNLEFEIAYGASLVHLKTLSGIRMVGEHSTFPAPGTSARGDGTEFTFGLHWCGYDDTT